MGLGRNGRGCAGNASRGRAMAMDLWYELKIREMLDVNEATTDLVRDAERSAAEAPDQEDEE